MFRAMGWGEGVVLSQTEKRSTEDKERTRTGHEHEEVKTEAIGI